MKHTPNLVIPLLFLLSLLTPPLCTAASQKTYTGTISSITTSGLYFSGSSGIKYYSDISGASLTKRNGSPLAFSNFRPGDKVEVKGEKWQDNSVTALSIRDMTVYAHAGTLSGKIISIEPASSTFIIRTSDGDRTILVSGQTSYKKNSVSSTFSALEPGQSVTVKGKWERKDQPFAATSVQVTIRMVNITVTGTLFMWTDNSLTIADGQTIYGVDITHAKLQNKKNKTVPLSAFNSGDTIRVTGKHPSGSLSITASTAKDLSIPK